MIAVGSVLITVVEDLIVELEHEHPTGGVCVMTVDEQRTFARNTKRRFHDKRDVFVDWDRCVYCSAPAEVLDHIIPLSQGGADSAENLAPACWSCNSAKGGRTPEQWFTGKAVTPARRAPSTV